MYEENNEEGNKRDERFVRRSVVFNKDLDQTIERVRKSLAMTRSGFIRYSVLRMLEELNVLSEKAHQEARITYV